MARFVRVLRLGAGGENVSKYPKLQEEGFPIFRTQSHHESHLSIRHQLGTLSQETDLKAVCVGSSCTLKRGISVI